MKGLPNPWVRRWSRLEWDFSRCPEDELPICLVWEYLRELLQREHGGVLPDNPIRFGDRQSADEWGSVSSSAGISVFKGRWLFDSAFPKVSYLERRQKGGFDSDFLPRTDWRGFVEIELHQVVLEFAERARTGLNRRSFWVGGEDATELAAFRIPWAFADADILKCIGDWLKANRPSGRPGDPRPRVSSRTKARAATGAGSLPRQMRSKLRKLSAWRILQHHKGNLRKVRGRLEYTKALGRQFERSDAWSQAKADVHRILEEEFAPTEIE